MLSALYQERLLAEYRAPKNRRVMPHPTGSAERRNPLCGDAIRIMVQVGEGCVADVAFVGQGCSVAVASASLLTQVVARQDVAEALTLVATIESLLGGAVVDALPSLLDPLRATVRFSARHSCVLMPWLALRDALKSVQ
jgi:nitrogen fixation protein NifU and related proteins